MGSLGTLLIDKRPHGLTTGPGWLRVESPDGDAVRLTMGTPGPSCECPYFRVFQNPCKHLRAARQAGLIPAAPAEPCLWCGKLASTDPVWGLCPECLEVVPKPEKKPMSLDPRPEFSGSTLLSLHGIAPISGGSPEQSSPECPRCKGHLTVYGWHLESNKERYGWYPCPTCDGTGRIDPETLPPISGGSPTEADELREECENLKRLVTIQADDIKQFRASISRLIDARNEAIASIARHSTIPIPVREYSRIMRVLGDAVAIHPGDSSPKSEDTEKELGELRQEWKILKGCVDVQADEIQKLREDKERGHKYRHKIEAEVTRLHGEITKSRKLAQQIVDCFTGDLTRLPVHLGGPNWIVLIESLEKLANLREDDVQSKGDGVSQGQEERPGPAPDPDFLEVRIDVVLSAVTGVLLGPCLDDMREFLEWMTGYPAGEVGMGPMADRCERSIIQQHLWIADIDRRVNCLRNVIDPLGEEHRRAVCDAWVSGLAAIHGEGLRMRRLSAPPTPRRLYDVDGVTVLAEVDDDPDGEKANDAALAAEEERISQEYDALPERDCDGI